MFRARAFRCCLVRPPEFLPAPLRGSGTLFVQAGSTVWIRRLRGPDRRSTAMPGSRRPHSEHAASLPSCVPSKFHDPRSHRDRGRCEGRRSRLAYHPVATNRSARAACTTASASSATRSDGLRYCSHEFGRANHSAISMSSRKSTKSAMLRCTPGSGSPTPSPQGDFPNWNLGIQVSARHVTLTIRRPTSHRATCEIGWFLHGRISATSSLPLHKPPIGA